MIRHAWLLGLLLAGCGGFGAAERGNRAYRDGRYEDAVAAYRAAIGDEDASPELRYNLGTALLREGGYGESQHELEAALSAVDPELRRRAFYNLGNRYLGEARSAPAAEESGGAGELLDAAVEAYKQALRLAPADTAAKWNLEMALREREESPPSPGGGGAPQQPREPEQDGERPGEGGGGGGDSPADQQPGQGQDGRGQPRPLTRAEAERILSAIEQDERQLLSGKLRDGGRQTPVARDW